MADTTVTPVAEALLACFCAALEDQHGTVRMPAGTMPSECCLRVGEIVSADASTFQDLCCSGLAWVRVADIFASSTDFPAPDTPVVLNCPIPSWGVVFELGVMRCAPTGDINTIPTCDEWTNLFELVMQDAAAMRAAGCCLATYPGLQLDHSSIAFGSWAPLPTSGGCAGGTMQISVQIVNCESC
jgi:hypothetical protein